MIGFVVFLLCCICVALIIHLRGTRQRMAELEQRLSRIEDDVHQWHFPESQPSPAPAPVQVPSAVPPPLPPPPLTAPEPWADGKPARTEPAPLPPLLPTRKMELPPPPLAPSAAPAFQWENFLGAKLFAWIAGVAVFLAVVFFVKYAFERNLISPQMRVGIGYAVGLGLVLGGLRVPRARYAVLAQTFCATGILVLYANSFAAHTYYDFFSTPVTFALMTVFTAAAFFLAVRLDGQVIAVLGLLGGFLTPPLLSTGVDRALGLFGYLALLDAGLITIALRKRWSYLLLLGAAATAIMQWTWVGRFFEVGKVHTGMGIFLAFAAMFTAAFAVARRKELVEEWLSAATVLMAAMAQGFALFLVARPYAEIATNTGLFFGYVFVANLPFLALAWMREQLRPAHVVAGLGVFLLLALWTMQFLTLATLNAALAAYLVFALLHTLFPLVLQKLRPAALPLAWGHLFPPLALLLVLFPLAKLATTSLLVWPVVLLIDLTAIIMAVLTASLLSILIVFVLTVLATAMWIFELPPTVSEVPGMLTVIGGFAVFFMAAAVFAAKQVFAKMPAAGTVGVRPGAVALTKETFAQICALAVMLPFLLLTMVVLRLPLVNPAPVFGLAAVLVVLLLGLARKFDLELLTVVGLPAVLLVEYTWNFARSTPAQAGPAVLWYLGFSALFLVFPFLFQQRFDRKVLPWVASALALPAHFFIVYRAIQEAAPEFGFLGLLPAALAVPCFLGLFRLMRTDVPDCREHQAQLALFGASTLLFVTLIFPIQFERQWITVGWALEGAALLWLFGRVPHPGLRVAGVVLLVAGFARLALNPWVFTAYGRTGTPILNWYLYAYGIVAVCLFAGARLLAPPRDRVRGMSVTPLLYALGTVLAFLLLNIEIADAFSPRGGGLVFHFSADFGQDMTYSIAWAVFAFALLAAGFAARNAPTRYAGMALLMVTLLKLFLHDIWRLGGLYRIGSLIGLAVVLLVVSMLYQRFIAGEKERAKAELAAP